MNQIPRLLERATARDVKQASTVAATLGAIDATELVVEYQEMMVTAPRRGDDGYGYFRERSGRPPQSKDETRGEARLAMALDTDKTTILAGNEAVDILMYEFPLYSAGGPKGIRSIDLVGHCSESQRFWVIELKVAARTRTGTRPPYGQTPLRALYEALIYAAVVESNMGHIASELEAQGRKVKHMRPGLLIAAPTEYWERWTPNVRIGKWWTPYEALTAALSEQLETPVETVDLGRIAYRIGDDAKPVVDGPLDCQSVRY